MLALSGTKLRVQYSTDGSSWSNLESSTTADLALTSSGTPPPLSVGAWAQVVAGARTDVFLRLVGAGRQRVYQPDLLGDQGPAR